jgi:predicted kinase
VAIPGARTPESVRSVVRATAVELSDEDLAALTAAFGVPQRPAGDRQASVAAGRKTRGDVVVVMGIPGAGKSRLATDYAERGYVRLNRDERGGSLRALAADLEEQLAAGVRRAVLDNTYLTRAARSRVVEAAERHSLAARCVWLDTPLAQAQANLVERLLDRFGSLPTPEQIRGAARREPWLMLPTSQMRALRELEPPATDEGFTAVETVRFARASAYGERPGVFVGAAATRRRGFGEALADADPSAPHLLFDWTPDDDVSALPSEATAIASAIAGPVEVAVCPHPGGPPGCWCRPPLPGLPLAFARTHSIDPASSILIGCSPSHRTLATTLGARYVPV